jgi:hypothetical protein
MLGGLTGWHLLDPCRHHPAPVRGGEAPALAKSVGQSARVFKGEMKAMKEDDAAAARRPRRRDRRRSGRPPRAPDPTPSPDVGGHGRVRSSRRGRRPRRDRRMSLAQHLTELRRRFIIGIIALVVGMIIAWIFTDAIIWAMTEPIRVVAAQRGDGDVVT